jgi:hypothetical protein
LTASLRVLADGAASLTLLEVGMLALLARSESGSLLPRRRPGLFQEVQIALAVGGHLSDDARRSESYLLPPLRSSGSPQRVAQSAGPPSLHLSQLRLPSRSSSSETEGHSHLVITSNGAVAIGTGKERLQLRLRPLYLRLRTEDLPNHIACRPARRRLNHALMHPAFNTRTFANSLIMYSTITVQYP